jgi:hypothetical protein
MKMTSFYLVAITFATLTGPATQSHEAPAVPAMLGEYNTAYSCALNAVTMMRGVAANGQAMEKDSSWYLEAGPADAPLGFWSVRTGSGMIEFHCMPSQHPLDTTK